MLSVLQTLVQIRGSGPVRLWHEAWLKGSHDLRWQARCDGLHEFDQIRWTCKLALWRPRMHKRRSESIYVSLDCQAERLACAAQLLGRGVWVVWPLRHHCSHMIDIIIGV